MFNERVIKLQPYTVSERDKFIYEKDWILLDWNESTIPISQKMQESLIQIINNGLINFYPDTHSNEALLALSSYLKIETNEISIFNGSDSALNISFECLLNDKDIVSVYGPEYSQIDTFVKMKGGIINHIPMQNLYDFDLEYINNSIKNSKIFYLSNPNNPTGRFIGLDKIEKLVYLNPDVFFFIDEAYHDFSLNNCSSLIKKYKNLIIFRTFSKAFGLAGLRIGYIISKCNNISVINKVRNGKEVNVFAQKAVCEILKDDTDIQEHINNTIKTRDWFNKELNNIPGFTAFLSQSNFVLVKHSSSKDILKFLFDNKILVRDRSNLIGLENCFRITIGTKNEMLKVLNTIIKWNETNYTRP
jgi:histidinol-phosphate aminotransferase